MKKEEWDKKFTIFNCFRDSKERRESKKSENNGDYYTPLFGIYSAEYLV